MTATVLFRIDPAKHMHRFYRVDVQPDLFGQMLMRECGYIGTTGRGPPSPFPEQVIALKRRSRKKNRNGQTF